MPQKETKSTKKPAKKVAPKKATSKTVKATKDSKVTKRKFTPKAKVTKSSAPAVRKTAERVEISAKAPRKKASSDPIIVALLCVIAVVSLAGLGLSVYNFLGGKSLGLNLGFNNNAATFAEGSISDIANKVAPSVVSIITQSKSSSGWYYDTTSNAAGTGMIISSDGYVLTNKHVVEDATKINVVLDDGTVYSDVTLIGTDPLNDAAIIKIHNVSDLKPVTIGDSKTLTIGQQVIAIGNALGQYQNSVTEGIISGIGRSITAGDSSNNYYETLTDMIQTDAQINSGNSGGPLLNAAGEVIGINTALSASGSSGNSISFAIPISSVKGIIKSVTKTGKLERAYIGVGYINLTPATAKSYGLSVDHGAYLSNSDSVIAGSPAEKADLKEDDIITKVNGVEIGKSGSLSTLIGEYTVGDTVTLTIIRDGKEITKDLTLAAYNTPTKQVIIRQ